LYAATIIRIDSSVKENNIFCKETEKKDEEIRTGKINE